MRPDWDKITEEAFNSGEEHIFSEDYRRRRAELLYGADEHNRKRIKVKRRTGFGVAATAAAVILIPAVTMLALHLNPGRKAATSSEFRQNAYVSEGNEPGSSAAALPTDTNYQENSDISNYEIYTKMHYSADNFDNVSGELVDCREGGYSGRIVKFACDLVNATSYSQCISMSVDTFSSSKVVNSYNKSIVYSDPNGVRRYYCGVNGSGGYTDFIGKPEIRRGPKSLAEVDYTNSPDSSGALSPCTWAIGMLDSAESWNVKATAEYIGRECAVIEGRMNEEYISSCDIADFTFYVDIATGVILKYYSTDLSGGYSRVMLMRSIAFGEDAEKVPQFPAALAESGRFDDLPEIMAVVGESGKTGFITVKDMLGGSDEELWGKNIDVYDTDLRTIVDFVTV